MFSNVESVARALKVLGIKSNDYVSVCMPNIPEVIYAFYAINRIGAVAHMLDVRSSASTLIQACKDAKSKVLLCIDMVLEKFYDCKNTELQNIIYISPANSVNGIVRMIEMHYFCSCLI